MRRHGNGRTTWKLSDETKVGIRMRRIAGAIGLLIVIVLVAIMETT